MSFHVVTIQKQTKQDLDHNHTYNTLLRVWKTALRMKAVYNMSLERQRELQCHIYDSKRQYKAVH